ncbi:MAG: transglycosylase SLT domain-containing protein [Gemmobacter sp.]
MKKTLRLLAISALAMIPAACAEGPVSRADRPAMRWDHRPEAAVWTVSTMTKAAEHDAALASLVPEDIDTWCPGYRKAGMDDRRAFWVGILSALAKHESTWNPTASGGGGLWIGLTQIDPRSARWFGCEATTAAQLKDGAANLACALRIASVQVPKDNMVAGDGRRGLGRDWAPFRSAAKRAEMAAWTRSQDYCQPVRPVTLSVASMSAFLSPAQD